LAVVYAGYKTPTAEVIARVNAARRAQPEWFHQCFEAIDVCVREAATAWRRGDWSAVGRAMNENQRWMEEMGVCDDTLSTLIAALRAQSNVLGAKISGSGLGDCVIGLGEVNSVDVPHAVIDVEMSGKGVTVEEA